MENKSLAVRFLVVFISFLLFAVSLGGVFLLVDDAVTQKNWPTSGSIYDHLVDNVDFYQHEITGTAK